MAIYRFEAKVISRGGNRSTLAAASYRSGKFANSSKSAVVAAAYRAGAQMVDERTGQRADYTNKRGVLGAEIMAPAGAAPIFQDRQALWNAVEAIEKRRDAQLARDFILTLPHELTQAQRVALTREFVAEQFCAKGFVADIAWHAPGRKGDERNHHCHVMVPMRRIEGEGFTARKDRPTEPGVHPLKAWQAELARLREAFADTANKHLAAAGLDVRIDHRSLAERGEEREPEPKIGPLATQIERSGRESLAGNDNRDVKARNAERAALRSEQAQAAAEEAQIIDLVTQRRRSEGVKPEPVTDAELLQQHQADLAALDELHARDTFKRQAEQAAEDAKKQREQTALAEARRQSEGEIPSAAARYSLALADHYDGRDPYGSLAKAAMAEYGALVRSQEQLRRDIAKEQDPDKRRVIELRKDIEAHDYMVITSGRLAGMSASIAGHEDAPQAILHYARGEMYAEQAAKLRDDRAAALIVVRDKEQLAREQAATNKTAEATKAKASDPARRPPADKGPAEKGKDRPPADAPDPRADMARAIELAQRGQQAQTPQPGQPAAPGQVAPTGRRDEEQAEQRRAKVTGKTEGEAELSDEQRSLLSELHEAKAAINERAAKKKDRDRGGGGRSGR